MAMRDMDAEQVVCSDSTGGQVRIGTARSAHATEIRNAQLQGNRVEPDAVALVQDIVAS